MMTTKIRLQKMMYLLSNTDSFVKSSDLAEFIGLSERTVKNEIAQLNELAESMGAKVVSKRGYGYKLEISDYALFNNKKEQLDIRFANAGSFLDESSWRTNEIIRMLITEEDYIKLNDIAEQLYLSRGAIRLELRKVREFLMSFNLSLSSKPGYGVKVIGSEMNKRHCMLEMYEFHYHKAIPNINNYKFLSHFKTDEKERNDIRHTFLKTLRESGLRVTDFLTQRIAIYLILLRNRYNNGYYLQLDKQDVEEIKQFSEYQVAKDIIENLQIYGGFSVPDEEISALGLLLLIWSDLSGNDPLAMRYSLFHRQASELIKEICENFNIIWDLDLKLSQEGQKILEAALIPILAQKHFCHIIKYKIAGPHAVENLIKLSPLSIAFSETAADTIKKSLQIPLSILDISFLAVRFYALIDKTSFDYVPRKIVICSRNGFQASEIIRDKLLHYFNKKFFETVDVYDFYEIRGLDQKYYDYLLLNFPTYSYRYTIPFIPVNQIPTKEEMEHIYKEVIAKGYQLEQLLESFSFEETCFFPDFEFISEKAFIKMISYKCGKDYGSIEALEKELSRHGRIHIINGVFTLITNGLYTKHDYLEVYQLARSGLWDNTEITAIVFISVSFTQNMQKVRFLEHLTHEFAKNPSVIKNIVKNGSIESVVEIVRGNIL